MKLNLAYPEKSDIPYTVINFSDSQKLLRVEGLGAPQTTVIQSRFSWSDLQLIIQAAHILKKSTKKLVLEIPYLLGARSDRNFDTSRIRQTHYLKNVVAPIINGLGFHAVRIQDAHSDVTEALIDNYEPTTRLKNLLNIAIEEQDVHGNSIDLNIIAPDAGASKRVWETTTNVMRNYNKRWWPGFKIVQAEKHRDVATGNITSTNVPVQDFKKQNCYIVDDLCDGGGTFIELAKVLKERNCGRIFLIVSHGIFSKGLEPFKGLIDGIYTTNSYSDNTPEMDKFINDNPEFRFRRTNVI